MPNDDGIFAHHPPLCRHLLGTAHWHCCIIAPHPCLCGTLS